MSGVSFTPSVPKTDDEWREKLTAQQYRVLREGATDKAHCSSPLVSMLPPTGCFACAGCGAALYAAGAKFPCSCGWPAFDRFYAGAVVLAEGAAPLRAGTSVCEVRCAACSSHLGHVFNKDRHSKGTGQRHCVNASALVYVDDEPSPEPNQVLFPV
eukprot:Rhum_TRINITY_DN12939_c0_g1::Rhum_TRINITY_DN12939_c0_g1_i1::g.55616::m.55616/K07305/msrB; peptide-methionine (R)-S-oxide reductase